MAAVSKAARSRALREESWALIFRCAELDRGRVAGALRVVAGEEVWVPFLDGPSPLGGDEWMILADASEGERSDRNRLLDAIVGVLGEFGVEGRVSFEQSIDVLQPLGQVDRVLVARAYARDGHLPVGWADAFSGLIHEMVPLLAGCDLWERSIAAQPYRRLSFDAAAGVGAWYGHADTLSVGRREGEVQWGVAYHVDPALVVVAVRAPALDGPYKLLKELLGGLADVAYAFVALDTSWRSLVDWYWSHVDCGEDFGLGVPNFRPGRQGQVLDVFPYQRLNPEQAAAVGLEMADGQELVEVEFAPIGDWEPGTERACAMLRRLRQQWLGALRVGRAPPRD